MIVLDLRDCVAGWIGGVVSTFVGYPLDTIKVQQQNFSTSFIRSVKTVYKDRGVIGFFRGMATPMIAYGPSNSIFFGWYSIWMRILQNDENIRITKSNFNEPQMLWSMYIAGNIAGLCQILFMCPVEMTKIKMQTSSDHRENPWGKKVYNAPYHSSLQAFIEIFRSHGVTGIFRGFIPMCIRDIPTSGVYMVSYEVVRHCEVKHFSENRFFRQILAGGVAGILSTVPVHPIDVVKTRMQADNPDNPKYSGMTDCIRKLYKSHGIEIFFKGIGANVIRSFPFHSTIFLGYELSMEFLDYLFPVK